MLVLVSVLWGAAAFCALLTVILCFAAQAGEISVNSAIAFAIVTGVLVGLGVYFQHA